MLEYDGRDISEEIDVNKTNASKDCNICHYFFLDKGFKFEPYLCNDYHDLIQKAILIMLLLFMLKEVIMKFIFGTQQKWCHKYNNKFWFKWKKLIIMIFFFLL